MWLKFDKKALLLLLLFLTQDDQGRAGGIDDAIAPLFSAQGVTQSLAHHLQLF